MALEQPPIPITSGQGDLVQGSKAGETGIVLGEHREYFAWPLFSFVVVTLTGAVGLAGSLRERVGSQHSRGDARRYAQFKRRN